MTNDLIILSTLLLQYYMCNNEQWFLNGLFIIKYLGVVFRNQSLCRQCALQDILYNVP